jgi:hypothetical protein
MSEFIYINWRENFWIQRRHSITVGSGDVLLEQEGGN